MEEDVLMSHFQKGKIPMEHYNMSDLLRGQASKIITAISENDTAGFILKNGKPLAVIISNDRYERLLKAGIDINEV
jgi:PHD/YefM family antitoxin component YafN of YafNO toxin-antitoxin module